MPIGVDPGEALANALDLVNQNDGLAFPTIPPLGTDQEIGLANVCLHPPITPEHLCDAALAPWNADQNARGLRSKATGPVVVEPMF
jgi:hypothetical protein